MINLRQYDFFKELSEEAINKLESISKKKSYQKGNILFYEKEEPTALLFLTEGVVKVYKTDLKNNEVIIRRFHAPTFIAEMATLDQLPFPASAAFETNGTVISIDYKHFEEHFMNDPKIAFSFIKSLSRKIKNLEEVIELNIVLDATARLAKYIYENESLLGELKNYQLAEDLHMTPETLSRTLKKLSVLGLLEKGGQGYVITNHEGLRVLFE